MGLTRPFSGRVPRPSFTIAIVHVPPLCPRPLTASVSVHPETGAVGFPMVLDSWILAKVEEFILLRGTHEGHQRVRG